MIERMYGTSFDWLTWLNGSPELLNLVCREKSLIKNKNILKKYAIGYCKGEELICRPRKNCYGVMFIKDDIEFWFHLRNKEFNLIFKEINNKKTNIQSILLYS